MNASHVTAAYIAAHPRAKRHPISPASLEQRIKVRDQACVNCGNHDCDPAHLTSRAQGGCDSEDCCIPLCRNCHRAFDNGALDLEPLIALPQFSKERSHMASHMSFARCIQRLRGKRLHAVT